MDCLFSFTVCEQLSVQLLGLHKDFPLADGAAARLTPATPQVSKGEPIVVVESDKAG